MKREHLQRRMKRLADRSADVRDMAGRRHRDYGCGQGWRVAGNADQTNGRGSWSRPRRTKVTLSAQGNQFAAVHGLGDRRHQQQTDAQERTPGQQSPRFHRSPLAASHWSGKSV